MAAPCAFRSLLLAEEKVDLLVINRIKSEAFENSKVMDHMFYLTDVNGPRLTGSPGFQGGGGLGGEADEGVRPERQGREVGTVRPGLDLEAFRSAPDRAAICSR